MGQQVIPVWGVLGRARKKTTLFVLLSAGCV